jgi:hypothetical protein
MLVMGITMPNDDVMVISYDDETWEKRQAFLEGMGNRGGGAEGMQVQFNYSCTRNANTFVPVKQIDSIVFPVETV